MMSTPWMLAFATVLVLLVYEVWLALAQQRNPQRLARTAHAALRDDWFQAVSQQQGSEVLAVQTLRNALMSATMTASTAVLGLMGTLTLTASSLHQTFNSAVVAWPVFTPRLAMALMVLGLLLASLVSSAMAIRHYTHAGFVCGMPVGSEPRQRWARAGVAHVRRAGVLYSWGLRQLILIVPLIAFLVHPLSGVAGAVIVVMALANFDRLAHNAQAEAA